MAEVSKPDFETGEPRSILSMHLHAKGIRKYQLTPVAWAGGVLPVQSDKYKHLDGSIDDFRQRAVLYSEAPETVIDAPLEYREMIIRSMAIFRYSPNKATMVRLSDGRVLHQNNASNAFYGLLTEKEDLDFFQDFLFQGDLKPSKDVVLKAFQEKVVQGRNKWVLSRGRARAGAGGPGGGLTPRRRSYTFRHKQCKFRQKFLPANRCKSPGKGKGLDSAEVPVDEDAYLWHETTLVAGTDPMQRVFNASAQANTLERVVIVLQMDISEVKRLQRDIRIAVSTCGRRAGRSGGLTQKKVQEGPHLAEARAPGHARAALLHDAPAGGPRAPPRIEHHEHARHLHPLREPAQPADQRAVGPGLVLGRDVRQRVRPPLRDGQLPGGGGPHRAAPARERQHLLHGHCRVHQHVEGGGPDPGHDVPGRAVQPVRRDRRRHQRRVRGHWHPLQVSPPSCASCGDD